MLKLLTSTSELAEMISSKVPHHILDGTLLIPRAKGDPLQSHFEARIPGSKYFDIDSIADLNSPYAHTMPSLNTWIHYMK